MSQTGPNVIPVSDSESVNHELNDGMSMSDLEVGYESGIEISGYEPSDDEPIDNNPQATYSPILADFVQNPPHFFLAGDPYVPPTFPNVPPQLNHTIPRVIARHTEEINQLKDIVKTLPGQGFVDITQENMGNLGEDSRTEPKSKGKRPLEPEFDSSEYSPSESEKETPIYTPTTRSSRHHLSKGETSKKVRINSSSYPNKQLTQNISKGSKFGYQGKQPLCNRCERHHSGYCSVVCQRCKKKGHMARNCKSTAPTPNANPKNTTTSFTCYKCGQVGHYRNNCPIKKMDVRDIKEDDKKLKHWTRDDVYKINATENRLENMERDLEIVKRYIQDIVRRVRDPRH